MNIEATLKRMRLSENQVKIYLAALELGEASISEIARHSGIKRSTAHLVIEELEILSLLSSLTKGKRRKFSAVHPRRLLQLAKSVEREVEEILPELVAFYNKAEDKPRIQVFEGRDGVRAVYRDIYTYLNNKKEMVGFTRIDGLKEAPGAIDEYKKILRKVKNPKIRELNSGPLAHEWADEIRVLRGKNHQIRVLPDKFPFGFSDNLIFENKLMIFSIKKNVFVIVIESDEIVKTYKALFEWAWIQGKECL